MKLASNLHTVPPAKKTRHSEFSPATERDYRKFDPDRWSTTDQAAGMFMLGLIYSLVLGGLAFDLAGAGHRDGSGFFLAVCLPGLVLWPAAALLTAFGNKPIGRWTCPAVLFIQYLLCIDTIALTSAPDRDDLQGAWARDPGVVLFFCALFLIGQAAIWFVYFIKSRERTHALLRRRITLAEVMIAIAIVALLLAMIVIPARWIFSRG
jgi:hypothetical protein